MNKRKEASFRSPFYELGDAVTEWEEIVTKVGDKKLIELAKKN